MKRFGVVTISLCVVLAVLCSAAIMRGRLMPANPDLKEAIGLNVCNGEPCFLDFTPNVTLWADVQKTISKYPHQPDKDNNGCIHTKFSRFVDDIMLCHSPMNFDKFGVVNIGIPLLPSNLPVGLFIDKYGLPCAVDTTYIDFRLIYPSFYLDVIFEQRLEPSLPVYRLVIHEKSSHHCDPVEYQEPSRIKAWHGFTHYHSP